MNIISNIESVLSLMKPTDKVRKDVIELFTLYNKALKSDIKINGKKWDGIQLTDVVNENPNIKNIINNKLNLHVDDFIVYIVQLIKKFKGEASVTVWYNTFLNRIKR